MATFFFSSITDAQAASYNAATDSILFNGGETATSVRFTINTLLGTYVMTTTSGRTLNFGSGILGENDFSFSDGSAVVIGNGAAQNLFGTAAGDALFGADGSDFLSGAGGNDVLNGGAGLDQMMGGPGADTFVFDPGQSLLTAADVVLDWSTEDRLEFSGLAGKTGLFESVSAPFNSQAEAAVFAGQEIAAGRADYVATRVGDDTLLFVDSRDDNGGPDDLVVLEDTGNLVLASNIVGAKDATTTGSPPPGGGGLTEPTLPDPTTQTGGGAAGSVGGSMDDAHIGHLLGAEITSALPGGLVLVGPGGIGAQITGTGFTYDSNEQLTGGLDLFSVDFTDATATGPFHVQVTFPFVPVPPFSTWVLTDATQQAFTTLLAGGDALFGSAGADLIRGYGGNDLLAGRGGNDTLWGGTGNDVIYATNAPLNQPHGSAGSTYLRGEEGDDYIVGDAGFDDANGNMGNDTISTGAGDDYSVGGKDNDLLFGDAGNDIVWGNLGSDTCVGGDGADQVRGGQGDDVLWGGAGNDFVSGDRGNDTITGGAGADLFHDSQDAGIDRVLDFRLADGDRVMLDPGTTFSVSQVGADTVIDMGGGNQMILVAVQMSTLPPGTIFLG